MKDMNDRNLISVNAPQSPRSRWGAIVIAVVVALAIIALIAAVGSRSGQQAAASPSGTATAVPSPSSTSTAQSTATQTASAAPTTTAASTTTGASSSTYQSPLGYTVQFGSPWRRSELQSRTSPIPQGDPDLLGTETFTTRTPVMSRRRSAPATRAWDRRSTTRRTLPCIATVETRQRWRSPSA